METIVHGLPPLKGTPSTRPAASLPIYAFVGRLVGTKGIRVLLEAARLLKSRGVAFQVKIIGEGAERSALEQTVRDLGIEHIVTFMGHVPSEKLDAVLSEATAVVMPSLAGEVFGIVAAENMQHGRLVIASDIGSLSEVVGTAGMKVAPGDPVALANCMETVNRNPKLREELGRKASERIVRFFSADQMIEEHLRVYEGLCRAR
jgi:glycosyltransferase involved in cell wall biosynthesis